MDIENFMLDFKDEPNRDVHITLNFYVNNALLMAQRVLLFSVGKTSVEDGILAYRVLIEQIEVLCRANDKLPENYDNDIADFEKKLKDNTVSRHATIANKKLELLMRKIFKSSPKKGAIKVTKAITA